MEKQERRLYFRAAMLLLVMMLTTVTTWADTVKLKSSTSTQTWTNGNTYVTNGDVTIEGRITVKGTVTLILTDGYTLTAPNGIEVKVGNSLTIEGGTNGTGTLIIAKNEYSKAGIGGGSGTHSWDPIKYGNITINGGIVNVKGGAQSAGIGGGCNSELTGNGTITINGGIVNAMGGNKAAGIGGGNCSLNNGAKGGCGDIVINGGQVTATGGDGGPGIGPGNGAADKTSGSLVLGWAKTLDFIQVTGGNSSGAYGFSNRLGSISFADGKKFNIVGVGEATTENIKNKVSLTLVPKGSEQNQLSAATISGISASYDLTGSYLDIPFSVRDAEGHTLTLGTDYTATLGTTSQESTTIHITEGGKYTLTITGKGSYAGSKSVDFEVISIGFKKDANGGDYINMPKTGIYYDAKIPEGVSSFNVYDDGGAKAQYSNNYDGGLVLTAPDHYVLQLTGTVTAEVWGKDLRDYLMVYDGGSTSAQKIGDKYGSDESGENIGTLISSGKQMTLTFHSDPSGQRDGLELTVTLKRDLGSCVIADIDDQTYTGSAFEPAVAITYEGTALVKDVDYEVTYSDKTTVGTATITITGKGNYAGTTSKTFTIVKATPTVTAPIAVADLVYKGSAQALVNAGSTDFGTLLYSLDGENYSADIPTGTDAGTYTIYYKVAGDANHNDVSGSIEVTITQKAVTNDDITITIPSQTWTGSELTPVITVKDGEKVLVENTDYTVTAPSGTIQDAGDYTYTISGKGNYSGEKAATFTIMQPKDIATCTATVPDQTMDGYSYIFYKFEAANNNAELAATLGIEVKDGNRVLVLGTDYVFGQVVYASTHEGMPENVGDECLLEIRGLDDYVGSKWAPFMITTPDDNDVWGDLAWSFHAGKLTINKKDGVEGNVAMKEENEPANTDYTWFRVANYVKAITIGEGVTSIAASAFAGTSNVHSYGNLNTVKLPSTLTTIGENAFAFCDGLTVDLDAILAKNITLGNNAFYLIGCLTGSLAEMADNTDVITLLDQAQRNNITLTGRTLYKDGDWNTLCLPFDVTDFTNTPLEKATVMELKVLESSLDSDGKLTLNFNNALSIEAGKPYIVKWASGDNIVNPVFNGVRIRKDDPTTVTSNDKLVQFIGIYGPETLPGNNASNLYLGADNNLYWPDQDVNLGAFRAYFHVSLSGEQLVREIRMNLDGDMVTEIHSVSGKRLAVSETAGWFDLFGRKLNGKPTVPGIYYNKGKKIAITE